MFDHNIYIYNYFMTTLVKEISILDIKEPNTPIFMEYQANNMMHNYYNKSITDMEYQTMIKKIIGSID